MSGIRSRLQNIFHHSNQSEPAAGSNSSPLSISKALSKTDSSGFLEIAAGTDPIVDIVAIHGLQGHRESTWTTEKGVCWLRDFLPFDLPNARVLTYGYDADTRSRECVSTQTMRRHAETFAQALLRNRKEAPRRPIIFIAYDLGGIILKWALVICHNQRLDSKCDLRDILISTHAILFFGTPHFGIEDAALLQAINRLASLYMKTTSDVLKDLKSQSFELENVQSLYVAASEKINCIFFCEEYAMSGIPNPEALNVQYPHATIPGDRNARTITLSSNHGELVKFPVKSNVNYEAVVYYLKDNVTTASAGVKEKWVIEDGCRSAAKGELISHAIMLPKRRPPVSKYYVERVEIEALMTEKLLPGGPVQHQPRCILHGPQGAGKTQLAAKWTRDHEKSFTRVIVVDASSQVQLEADLERSIRSLGPEFSKMTWEDAVAYLDDNEKGWLLFIDNADSPDLKLDPYLPNSVHGTMIIATRNRGYIVHAPNGLVSVGGLEEGEAVKLLHAIANIAPKSDAQSLEIVRELGMLVLAITQAGACIRITQRLDTYLDAFHKQRAHITGVESAVDTDCAFSTRTAFDLSFQHLPTKTQEFMKLCAFLNPSHIPFALFEQSSSSHFTAKTVLESYPPQQSDRIFISDLEEILGRTWDEIAFRMIVESASRASFINVSTDGLFYTIHPAIQGYIKDSFGEEEIMKYTRAAAQLLLGAMRSFESTTAQRWQLLPHINCIPRSVQSENVAHALAFHDFYDSLGDWKACQDLLRPVFSKVLGTRGQRNEISIWLMENLAHTLSKLGYLHEAENMQRDVFSLRLQMRGIQDPDTAKAMNNLADTLHQLGQLEEAEKMKRDVLALRLKVLGPRHLDTITTMDSLASTLDKCGRLQEAEEMRHAVLALRVEILGRRHLDTISTMQSLANTLHKRGQLDKAEEMKRYVLAARVEILGRRHPDTITTMDELANTLHRRGQLDAAEKIHRDVLSVRLQTLGQNHPDTIRTMGNLANTLRQLGQLDEAEKMHRNVLNLRRELLGKQHPDTIWTMKNLASTLQKRGKLEEAEKMRWDALALSR